MTQEELTALEQAARTDPEAQYRLGMLYVYGEAVPEDYGRAIALLTSAADQGHVEAAYNLAICYHYGFGTPIDLEKAFALYLFSAQKGYAKGKHLIGRFYYHGWYVPQDEAEAIRWFEASAQLNDPTSCGLDFCYLGACYARGRGVRADPVRAEELFRRAIADGGDIARKRIEQLMQ